MADYPASRVNPPKVTIVSQGSASLLGSQGSSVVTSTTWPAVNRAIFVAVVIEAPVLVQQMSLQVVTQAGNVDVGIYNEKGIRIISSGTTGVAAAGLQAFNITDTVLTPGLYFLAAACDSTSAVFRGTNYAIAIASACSVGEMASAFVLPTTATIVTVTAAYQPKIAAHCVATV